MALILGIGGAAQVFACGGDTTPAKDGDSADATTSAMDGSSRSAGDGAADGHPIAVSRLPDGAPLPSGECLLDEDCDGDGAQRCLFLTGAACGSIGTCRAVAETGPGCAEAGLLDPTQQTSCSCDGTPRYQPCGLPAGYTRGDIVHPGPCADGGQVCDPALRNCPLDQICGFRVADGCSVTAAHCFDGPDPTIFIPGALLVGCGCDGGRTYTFPDTELYVMAPMSNFGDCPAPDAGDAADAGTDAH